jgi:flagellar basal-body rod protein FlgC
MLSALNIAVSGLFASSKRLDNSANNVANVSSTVSRVDGQRVMEPFKPQDVVQTSQISGGVSTDLRERDPASVPLYDPNNIAADADGITDYPNVNLEEEIITQQIAGYDFKANLKVIETTDEMSEDLLNIVA